MTSAAHPGPLPLIPENKQDAVRRALSVAFGVTGLDDIRAVTGGLSSARIFRIVVAGRPCLLRVIMNEDPIADPTSWFACMQAGAGAGIAPRVWYTNSADRVAITDFVTANPPPADAGIRMAGVIRKLHALPGFPPPKRGHYFDLMDGFVRRFEAAGILPESAWAEMRRGYDAWKRVYPRGDLVASHNDLKLENIVFEGERTWVVDWEAAFLNDPYLDLAVAANFFARDAAEVAPYLQAYFGEPAGAHRLARFHLMQGALHVFYAAFLLLMGAKGQPVDPDQPVPDFEEFHRRILAGKFLANTDEAKRQYGLVHLRQAVRLMRAPRFAEALALVAASG